MKIINEALGTELTGFLATKFAEKSLPYNSILGKIQELQNSDDATEKQLEALERKKERLEEISETAVDDVKNELLNSDFKTSIENKFTEINEKFTDFYNKLSQMPTILTGIGTCCAIITSAPAAIPQLSNLLMNLKSMKSDLTGLENSLKSLGLSSEDISNKIPLLGNLIGAFGMTDDEGDTDSLLTKIIGILSDIADKQEEAEENTEEQRENQEEEENNELISSVCPRCGEQTLEWVDPNSHERVICTSCAWTGYYRNL